MPGGRPDPQRVQAQASVIFAFAGETATWFSFTGTTNNAPRYGAADTFSYTTALITGLFYFRRSPPTENQRPGGQVQEASLHVAAPFPLGARDQLNWRGSAYRVDGSPWPENLGGRVQWNSPLMLANPVG